MPASPRSANLADVRVAVVSTEQPGERMAGPAIRATALATGFQRLGASVTLACRERPDADFGVSVRVIGPPTATAFRRLAASHDVVWTQPVRMDVARGLHRGRASVVYDLYVPYFVEYLAAQSGEAMDPTLARLLRRRIQREYATAIRHGDAFVCASDRQRDHWLGALGQAGRLRPRPSRSPSAPLGTAGTAGYEEVLPLTRVVPFGLPDEPPAPARTPVLRGVLVPDDAFLLLWTGGLWNWFDPVTLLEGLRAAVDQNPRIHLVIMGAGHADARWRPHAAQDRALQRARELGLLDSGHVVVVGNWVPYGERAAHLLEADLGVCAYRASDETRLSFRTRFLDHLWAGLATVSTSGGSLTELMTAVGAARTVPPGDAAAWSRTLLALAADPAAVERMSLAAAGLAERFTWRHSVAAAAEVVGVAAKVGPTAGHPSLATTADYLGLLGAVRLRERVLRLRPPA